MNNERDKHQGSQTVNPGREQQQQQGDKKPGQPDFNRDKQQGGADDRDRRPGNMPDQR